MNIDKEKLIELIDERIQESQDDDYPTNEFPSGYQAALRQLKRTIEEGELDAN